MNKSLAKKYVSEIKSAKAKHLTSDALSRHMGIYPEIIREQLSFFDPIITMDLDINIRDLLPQIEAYIEEEEAKAEKKARVVIKKSELQKYGSIAEFVYEKYSINGLVDRNAVLNEVDLKTLKKLVDEEIAKNSKKGKKKPRKRR